MRVDCAMLCDAATVREGLLHILGGGITRLYRPEFPAPLGTILALRILVHPTEIDRQHHLTVVLQNADGGRLGALEADFGVQQEALVHLEPGEEASVALPIGFPPQVELPLPGRYSFEVLIDGIHQSSIGFSVSQLDMQQLQPPPPEE